MNHSTAVPTVFESLAAINKFIAVPRLWPRFYARHRDPVDFAGAFLRIAATSHPQLEQAFRKALPLALGEGAVPIRDALSAMALSNEKMRWFDDQITEVLRALAPTVRDPALPQSLNDCKWAIEGALK